MKEDHNSKKLERKKLPLGSTKLDIIFAVKKILTEYFPTEITELMKSFKLQYATLIKEHESEDTSDLLRYYRITTQYKPALASILKKGSDLDEICDKIELKIETTRSERYSQTKKADLKKKSQMELKYFCAECGQYFEISPEKKVEIEESDEIISLPIHHGKEMLLKIVCNDFQEKTVSPSENNRNSLQLPKSEKIRWDPKDSNVNSLQVLSVGIDVGSSTSHLVFSKLTLRREFSFTNKTNQFKVVTREIIYEGNIIFTPLLDTTTIDTEKIIEFFKKEYANAKITPEMVDTGAVIVTGEAAKKNNAAQIVQKLSSESGKFVSATAGPNFESMLGIMGSGMVEESKQLQKIIMNIDIGGGTSNIAIASNGEVVSTSCINVGGRLLGIDQEFKIWRIDEPTKWIMEELKLHYQLGDTISEEAVLRITKEYAKALVEVMQGPAINPVAKMLMMTEDIVILKSVEKFSFTGGVAEMIYDKSEKQEIEGELVNFNPFNDIGKYLAIEIRNLMNDQQLSMIEPRNKIRATVIGAGAFSLSVSGSTCYWDGSISFPLDNIPVVPIHLDFNKFFFDDYEEYMKHQIDQALHNFSLVEGEDEFALYFKDQINQSALVPFVKSIEKGLPNSVLQNRLILIILGEDGGKMLGLTLKRETSIKENLLCLDELDLETGDWIDIGAPLNPGSKRVFPITKKSLIFNNN